MSTIGVGNVLVTGGGAAPYSITFRGALGLAEQPKLEIVDWNTWLPASGLTTLLALLNPPPPVGPTTTTIPKPPETVATLDAKLALGQITFDEWLAGRGAILQAEIISGATTPANIKVITGLFPKAPEVVTTVDGKLPVPEGQTGPLCSRFDVGYFFFAAAPAVRGTSLTRAASSATSSRTTCVSKKVRTKVKGKFKFVTKRVCTKTTCVTKPVKVRVKVKVRGRTKYQLKTVNKRICTKKTVRSARFRTGQRGGTRLRPGPSSGFLGKSPTAPRPDSVDLGAVPLYTTCTSGVSDDIGAFSTPRNRRGPMKFITSRSTAVAITAAVAATMLFFSPGGGSTAGAATANFGCTGIDGDVAGSVGPANKSSRQLLELLATLGGSAELSLPVAVTVTAPASVKTGSGPYGVAFDYAISLPDTLVSSVKTLLKLDRLTITNASFAIDLSGAATGSVVGTTASREVSLASTPVAVSQAIAGVATPSTSGLVYYRPGASHFSVVVNGEVAGSAKIGTITVLCTATGLLGSTAVKPAGAPNIPANPIIVAARPTSATVVRLDDGAKVLPDEGNPITWSSLAWSATRPAASPRRPRAP